MAHHSNRDSARPRWLPAVGSGSSQILPLFLPCSMVAVNNLRNHAPPSRQRRTQVACRLSETASLELYADSRVFQPHRVLAGSGTDRGRPFGRPRETYQNCLLYTSDAADDLLCVDLGGRRIIKK